MSIRAVALYARAWVEIAWLYGLCFWNNVALYARAWVEIFVWHNYNTFARVALYARAWVEIVYRRVVGHATGSPSTRGRG